MALVEIENLAVDFPIYHGSSRSLKKTVFAAATGRLSEDARHRMVVQALRDITFTLRPGDRLGLVGHNGAGKTTLLRALAGIYEPVSGHVRVQGSMGVLIDPNQGMNVDCTGRENVFLRGRYTGMSRVETNRLLEDVREFADLGEFMDLPVRFYSSGMMVRLGFALATAIRPQVLLMDEWFLAGDAEFMKKATVRLESMVRDAEILVLSSHSTPVVLQWCTRAMWLDQGRVKEDGAPAAVLSAYLGQTVEPPDPADTLSALTSFVAPAAYC